MSTLFRKYSTLISIVLLVTFLISVWIFPSARSVVVVIFLLFIVAQAFTAVIVKHRESYLQGKIMSAVFVRNVLIETTYLLLAMILAGFLGRFIAQIATQQISNDLMKFAAGITIGLLVGVGVGVVMQRISGRFITTSIEK